jgi:hypothetical protein
MRKKIGLIPGGLAAVGVGAALAIFFLAAPAEEAVAAGTPKPATHDAAWADEHGTFATSNDASCYTCHEQHYCDSCHASDDPTEAYHKTNYVYTHYLDKFIDDRECAACHDNQEFCNTCHEAAAAEGGGRPASHNRPGWITTGHADVAAYEIDSCAACHDPAAADPTCMRCHRTGISPHGNNPIIDVADGPWQNDPGYVCFRCHSTSDPRLMP